MDHRLRWPAAVGALAAAWLVASIVLPQGAPLGPVLIGAILGAASALAAVGLILVWRSARIVNFAVGALGAATGLTCIRFYTAWGWSYPVALVAGTVCGVAMGVAVEVVVIRRFVESSRLVLTVATIGLAQLLGGIELLLPGLVFGEDTGKVTVGGYETPLSRFRWTVGGSHVIDGNHVLICAVVPLVVLGLHLFLQRSRVGIATRAAAENRSWARLLGIPVARLSMVTWGVAGGLAALTFVLKAPFVGTVPQAAVGPSALLVPLAAAIIARMESMSVACAAAVVLGATDQLVRWNAQRTPGLSDVVILVVILLVLMTRRAEKSRALDQEAQLQIAPASGGVPRGADPTAVLRAKVGSLVAAAGAIAVVPQLVDDSTAYTLAVASVWAIVAVSTVVVTGWTGQLSFGQFAIAGFSAAVAGNVLSRFHLDLFVALGAGMVTGIVVAVLLGIPALRIRGPFLGVATLAFAVVVDGYFLNPNYFPDLIPDNVGRPVFLERWSLEREQSMLVLCLVVLAAVVVVASSVRSSRSGRNLLAVRDNPRATEAQSVSQKGAALRGFVLSGAFAGLAGALHVMVLHGVRVGTFRPSASIDSFSATTIGGLTSLPAAVVSGFGVRAAQDVMSAELRLVAMGVGVLVILWLFPAGLAGLAAGARGTVTSMRAARAAEHTPNDRAVEQPVRSTSPQSGERESTTGSAPAVATRGLEVSFGQLKVLFGVDISVADGEVLALLGTNGAGKSTWLKAVMGLVPSSGEVTVGGVDTSGWSTERLVRSGIALMIGGRSTFPTMTVAEHFRLAAWIRSDDRAGVAADRREVLELFPSLERRMHQRAGDLSGGEQQQLALAQTLLLRPTTLFIDELSLGLSPIIVDALLDVVRQMNRSGITVVVVEQSVNVAMTMAERAVFLEKGEVRFVGPTAELRDRPDVMRSIFFDAGTPADEPTREPGEPAETAEPVTPSESVAPAETVDLTDVSSAPALTCVDVVKRFGGVTAVDHVNLTVAPGEIVGFIGQNGAGKSTLLDCLSGFHAVDGGSIAVHGRDVAAMPPWRRAREGLGRSFQEARLFPGLTVTETLAVARERHVTNRSMLADALRQQRSWMSEQETAAVVDRVIADLGLAGYRDTLTSALSTGTRRVAELACLVVAEPTVLLLDEPSAGVAQRDTEALGPLLVQLRDLTSAAVVIVEHDVALLRSICERLVAFDLGRIIADGPPMEVLADPAVISAYLGNNSAAIERTGAGVAEAIVSDDLVGATATP